jgi:hypothetical protein
MAIAELERESLLTVEEESYWTVVFRRFRKHKLALLGIIVILLISVGCHSAQCSTLG